MAAEAPIIDLYDEQGRSRFLHSPVKTSHPLSNDHSIRPLWLGTLSDLTLIDNPTRNKYLGDQDRYRSLEKYIRLSWGLEEIPVYVVDHHEAALYCWYEALAQGRITPGARLIHYDDHSDAAIASSRAKTIAADALADGNWTLDDAVTLVKKLGCWEFIEPAQRSGLVGQFIYVTPGTAAYTAHYPPTQSSTEHTEMSVRFYEESRTDEEPQNKIVDVDLDFFASKKLDPTAEEEYIQLIRRDIATAGVVTFATSPGFIDPERAVLLVKKILT